MKLQTDPFISSSQDEENTGFVLADGLSKQIQGPERSTMLYKSPLILVLESLSAAHSGLRRRENILSVNVAPCWRPSTLNGPTNPRTNAEGGQFPSQQTSNAYNHRYYYTIRLKISHKQSKDSIEENRTA